MLKVEWCRRWSGTEGGVVLMLWRLSAPNERISLVTESTISFNSLRATSRFNVGQIWQIKQDYVAIHNHFTVGTFLVHILNISYTH